ncbi:PREDICTED: 1-phosphatidylinositol 4,5-bisphosphate phosphodiesterase delta-4-like [Branchiostoma belcheri]|uniref:Phosphoinositide phospholipase C n=1 Tax=Branchiostoma belcheri TaxID=7741 RepID=A0A6P4Z3V6_BRABE|nr:PREDICTED: 1-phosphatidylinositol 4,5-bisphosphate phosphodiesterase delta-4-like [Branchiostoma belcheri]XP_019636189.1 PREDICTED: 1-phosphatidylinositol 4,5-bisphosphate phosphodiesterase delta-4-like [Branchiostoma belcheri]XP_019636190.1 PREDICTED: 1-phosphatidylinositol 4,5-bisphosphate phosphodiesterase delta-4-like [Branchiostoma belcheri]
MDGESCVTKMAVWTPMTKCRENRKKYKRKYRLRKDMETIEYTAGMKSCRACAKRPAEEQNFEISNIAEVFLSKLTVLKSRVDRECVTESTKTFSIYYKDQTPVLDLECSTEDIAKGWVTGIQHLMRARRKETIMDKRKRWISEYFHKGKNTDDRLESKEAKAVLAQMNIQIKESQIDTVIKKLDKDQTGTLNLDEFTQFYNIMTARREVEELFDKWTSDGPDQASHVPRYAVDGENMKVHELMEFLAQEQKVTTDLKGCHQLIEKFEPNSELKKNNLLSLEGFTLYLESDEGDIFNHTHDEVYQDMTQPLSHYFIASSHNTYLLEDQLRGPSSKEGYIRVLLKGCRFLELDCWDGDDGEPVIYHGYTFTSKVLFREVIEAIGRYAFKASRYPVFLSLENHCSVAQQRVLAAHLVNILGDSLCNIPATPNMQELPSPHRLREKIIVKNKKLKRNVTEDDVSDEDEAAETEDVEVQERVKTSKGKEKKKTIKLAKELSDLVNICEAVHFHSFQHSREKDMPYNISSIKEGKANDMVKDEAADFIDHTKRQLVKIYPSGGRVDSSNIDPHLYWSAGCQIVALNYQTPCDQMDLNLGLFRQNGGCGYVLKPDALRDEQTRLDTAKNIPSKYKKTLKIKVISGYQLPTPEGEGSGGSAVDPYVKVQVYGVPGDCAEDETEVVKNNGFHPVWNSDMTFPLTFPDLAMLRFEVKEHDKLSDSETIGQFSLPVTSMQQGYRHVHLLSKDQEDLSPAALFIHVSLQ